MSINNNTYVWRKGLGRRSGTAVLMEIDHYWKLVEQTILSWGGIGNGFPWVLNEIRELLDKVN